MKSIIKEIKLYKFEELKEYAKDRAITEYIDFITSTTEFSKLNKNTNLYRAFKKSEELQTPWFLGDYIWKYCKEDMIPKLKMMWFLESGEYYEN